MKTNTNCLSKLLNKFLVNRMNPMNWLLTAVLFATLVLECEARKLTVGYLANIHGKQRQGHIISGAITYAIEEVNRQGFLPPNYTLEFVYEDTMGETLPGTKAVITMWREGIVAFFGPENSCDVEATVSAALNLPMISYKCADAADKDFSDRDFKNHFARTYPPNTMVVSSVIVLLRYYKWNKFSIVYENSDVYVTVMKSLEKAAVAPFRINHKKTFENTRICCYANKDRSCCVDPFSKIVRDTKDGTRIYLFLGDTTDLGKFLTVLQMRGLLSTGNYVVIYIDLESYTESMAHKYFRMHDEESELLMKSAQSLLVIVPTPPRGHKYVEFLDKVREYNRKEPFNFRVDNIFPDYNEHVTPYAAYLYDAVTLYADALGKALRNNTDPRNGSEIMSIFRKKHQYTSVTGAIMRLSKNGDVEGNYTVLSRQLTPKNLTLKVPKNVPIPLYSMLPVGRFYMSPERMLRFKLDKDILWVNPDKPPAEEPPCGFDGTACKASPDKTKEISSAILGSILLLSCFVIYMVYKNWKYEQEIDGLLWKIDLQDIQGCGGGMVMSASKMSLASHMSMESKVVGQIFTQTGMFKGTLIAVKQLRFSKKTVDISRKTKKEMKIMREMHHDYINQFIGACVCPNCVYIVTEYCSKGSLQDILENDDLKLDNMFIASLVFDLIKGMIFLHDSDLKFHGNLKSSNCVVSSRWVLQVTDFGLHELRANSETGSVAEHQYYRNLLWKAPELLRYPSANPFGNQKGDIYAFGIILHEIIARQGPFGYTELTPKEIVMAVQGTPAEGEEPFRPPTTDLECQDYVLSAMKDAWHERPEARPDFRHIKEKLRKMREGMKSNIMDNMMSMMEKYAYNLEELVDERTVQLVEEKKKTEALLHRMLPKSVANQLMRGEAVIPESFDAVTIYFSDIVGFTEMSATSTPMEVVTFLNDLYTVFDDIISHYDVYKVETIGDAYMVVSGLPIRNGDNHAGEIAFMALELLDSIRTFKIRHKENQTLKLRVGVHTGPVCAGVVGLTMPRYCLFGDTVNTASRMESNGEALKIHISPECKEYLDKLGGYYTTERGKIKVKGKGDMTTYWLLGHANGPKKKQELSPPPPPLFSHHNRHEDARRRSPKLGETSRRGSLASRRNSSYVNCSEEDANNSAVVPLFLRINPESPRLPRRLSPQIGREHKFLRVTNSGSWLGYPTANSCGELCNECPGTSGIDNWSITPTGMRERPLSPLAYNEGSPRASRDIFFPATFNKEKPVSPSSIRKPPKLQSICSEDCEMCAGNPDSNCQCRNENNEAANNKNGLINIDESLRPLLCTKELKADLILPKGIEKSTHLKPPVFRLPSKKWRSCDEIVLPKGSRSSLKDFFSGLLNNKTHDSNLKKGSKFPSNKTLQENCRGESLV